MLQVVAVAGLVGCAWALVAIVFDYFDRPRVPDDRHWSATWSNPRDHDDD